MATPRSELTAETIRSRGRRVAPINIFGVIPIVSSLSLTSVWQPNTSSTFSPGKFWWIKSWRTRQSSCLSKRVRRWISSFDVTSIPGITARPLLWPTLIKAAIFSAELWSQMAIISNPMARAWSTTAKGLISSSPQGERHEWMWRSARNVLSMDSFLKSLSGKVYPPIQK